MRLNRILWAFVLCASALSHADNAVGTAGGAGTEGGGGTLKAAFKEAAVRARERMWRAPSLPEMPSDPKVAEYYERHRLRWVDALNRFAKESNVIAESGVPLFENGIEKAAMAVPPEAPQQVVLSVPYLIDADHFDEKRAFLLAVHEAGHFANQSLLPGEHDYFDQIALALYGWEPPTFQPASIFALDEEKDFTDARISSDGTTLSARTGYGWVDNVWTVSTTTKLLSTQFGPGVPFSKMFLLDGDWVLVNEDAVTYSEIGYYVRNQLTGEIQRTKMPISILDAQAVDAGLAYRIKDSLGKLTTVDLLTGQSHVVQGAIQDYCPDNHNFYDSKAMTEVSACLGRVEIRNLVTGHLLWSVPTTLGFDAGIVGKPYAGAVLHYAPYFGDTALYGDSLAISLHDGATKSFPKTRCWEVADANSTALCAGQSASGSEVVLIDLLSLSAARFSAPAGVKSAAFLASNPKRAVLGLDSGRTGIMDLNNGTWSEIEDLRLPWQEVRRVRSSRTKYGDAVVVVGDHGSIRVGFLDLL